VKEIPRRRITVTSSLNEISLDHLENRVGEGALLRPPPSLYTVQQASGLKNKDDMNSFSSTDYCYTAPAKYTDSLTTSRASLS
jgi:hypothetical protein